MMSMFRKSEERPRGMLLKFTSHKPKERVVKSKKTCQNVRVSENLAAGTRTMLQALQWKQSGLEH